MTDFYLRDWSLDIDGEPFITNDWNEHMLRCAFDIEVFPNNSLAFADIRIYNLSKETKLEQGSALVFKAGYRNNSDVIFTGTISNVFRLREGADIITRIYCRSGSAKNDRGTMNSSYGVNTSIVDILVDVARSWPRELVYDPDQFADSPLFTNGYTAHGDIVNVLDSLSRQFDFQWTLERGALVISKNDAERKTPVFEVNQFTGMVGYPEVTRGPQGLGVMVAVRIDPKIRVSDRINITSEFSNYNTGNLFVGQISGDVSANGEFNILGMRYLGDSHGDEWNIYIDGIRAGTREVVEVGSVPTNGGLIFGARVDQDFRVKVRDMASRQRLDPNWYMAVIAFETGETFDPAIRNAAGSGATGLIGFMPNTASGLGTTTEKLANMTAVQQLKYVEDYFNPYKNRIKNIDDMYMAVLWPKAIGKPDDYVLWRQGIDGKYYSQNSGLDKNKDGTITKAEAASRVRDMYRKGMQFVK